ncbi:AP3-complex subunit beta-A [Macadamia integrifolia]|uniref:AP3-complex subunit beta-A n=1 Tax=Macadamia integrifolia TaxID=60698 RepID=UPI001C4F6452|nr:AP3-complex subunit beta-A [Macadamia integrifolia]
MFPQFGATAESLSKASSLVFRIGSDAHLYDDPEDVNIAPLLDSRYDSEICEALKRLLALIAQGFDVSRFFPQVVKNVASQSLEVKKLVYLYLLHYADKRPNEALLSINCFQKDLSDPNPLVRAWALRAMAGIRLHVISPIVLAAVSKSARDPSVYVRKCAANAIPKLSDLHQEENASALEEIVNILLSDQSPGVVGAAAAAFICVCPNKLSLLGRNFRKLCETLPDVEEWGQIVLIGILLRYVVARHGLPRESILFSSHSTRGPSSEEDGVDHAVLGNDSSNVEGMTYESDLTTLLSRCYIEGPDEYLSRSGFASMEASGLDPASFTSSKNNEDVRILLQCTSPLLWSHNSAVVLAAAGVHWIMTPREDVKRIVKPLLFLLRSSSASKYVVLCNIQVFAKAMPSLFAPHFEDFFISSSDSHQIKSLKLEILSTIATDSSISLIFQEFKDYIKDPNRKFVAATVAAIGLCAQRLPTTANACLDGLLALTRQEYLTSDLGLMDEEACVLAQAIMSIKAIIKQDPASHEKWELCIILSMTSSQVVLFAQGEETETFKKILTYVLELAKYDPNYDIRDRARVLKKLLSCYISSQVLEKGTSCSSDNTYSQKLLVEHIFGGKTKSTSSMPINDRFYLPGSLSQIVLHAAPGYEPLPKPCTLLYDDLVQRTEIVQGIEVSGRRTTNSDSFGTNDPDTLSGSLNEESASSYGSQYSITSSDKSEDSGSASEVDDTCDSLIHLSDTGTSHNKPGEIPEENDSLSFSDELRGLMSERALESWLNEQSGLSQLSSSIQKFPSFARISLRDIADRVKPKTYTLLDPANSNGLRVDYLFSSEVSTISSLLLCVEIFFDNHSTESLVNISLTDEDPNQNPESANQVSEKHESSSIPSDVPTVIPMEEITCLQPGQMEKKILQVRFHHHLLPLKLVIWCSGKKHPVKLRPDIGYFVKPLPMDIEAFICEESKLRGMFEYTRGCTFVDHIDELNHEKDHSALTKDRFLVLCRSLAVKMLSNANLFLVSVDMPVAVHLDDASGLCLRFSCEILSNCLPCLITLNVEGKCSEQLNVSVKVNCEETMFGLNLLNRVVAFLS